jgi:uncharacterized protein
MKKSVAKAVRTAKAEDAKFQNKTTKALKGTSQDSFVNFIARLGYGQNNQLSASRYQFHYLTRNRTELEAAYRTAWMVGAAVDLPAEDMTRAGVEFKGKMPPDQIDKFQACLMELQIWQNIREAIKWSRLFGGAVAVMLIDGQDLSKPFRPETVGQGQFKGLFVLDRWLIQPNLTNLVTEMGPELGLPKFYDVVADARALSTMRIHHSRVLRFEGLDLPYYQKLVEMMWGSSVIERIFDRMIAFDSATMGAAQLAFKAHLRVIKIDQLRDVIATGGEAREAMVKQLEMIRLMQTNEGLTVLDKTDEFDAHQYTFAGLPDVILQIGQQLSGALQIPLVRLFGQSPQGLNSSGESDLRTYYDNINKTQESTLRRSLTKLFNIIYRSEIGPQPPPDFNFKFNPLWQLTEVEKAEIANKDADTMDKASSGGFLSQSAGMKELRQSASVSGRFSNITDEDIKNADQEPPSASEMLENEQQEGQPGGEDPEGKGDVSKGGKVQSPKSPKED